MKEHELTAYYELLSDIKVRVRQAQIKAALSANAMMIWLYWDIGRMIADRQAEQGWGAKVIPRLAVDLKNELPEEKAFLNGTSNECFDSLGNTRSCPNQTRKLCHDSWHFQIPQNRETTQLCHRQWHKQKLVCQSQHLRISFRFHGLITIC